MGINAMVEIKRLRVILAMSHGEIVRLMREVSQDGTVVSLAQLRRRELADLLDVLISIQSQRLRMVPMLAATG